MNSLAIDFTKAIKSIKNIMYDYPSKEGAWFSYVVNISNNKPKWLFNYMILEILI